MALTNEQKQSLLDMAHQIGQETIANGLGSPEAQATGSPSYNQNASPRERYNQLWEIRRQQAAETSERRKERSESVRSNFLSTMNQIQEKQSRIPETSATPAPGSVQEQNLEFLSQYQQENSLLARLKKAGQAAVSGIKDAIASNTDAQRALYEAGQSGREMRMREDVKEIEENLARARRDYDQLLQLHNGDTNNKDVKAAVNVIDHYETLLSAYKKAPEAQRGATEETSKIADEVKKSAEKDIERIKKNAGRFERFGIDIVSGLAQLAGDRAIGGLLGTTTATPALVARAFGGATQQARQGGGTIGQQIAYGSAVATVEAITEKLADGLAGAYGPGEADDIAEEVIRRLAKSPAGQTALRTLYGMGSEFAEEFVSNAANPTLRSIYNGKTVGQNYSEESVVDWLYDGMIAAATSLVSGTPERMLRGQDARLNATNESISSIYEQMNEKPGVKQAVRDRDILKSIRGGKDYGNLSVGDQASEAMEALRGITPESVRAGQLTEARNRLFEMQQQRAAEAQAAQKAAGAQEVPEGQVTQPTAEATPETAGTAQESQEDAQTAEQTPAEAPAPETPKSNVQRFQEIQKRLEEINNALNENPDEETASSLYEEGEALYQESRQLETEPEVIQQKRVDAGEVSKGFGTVENHIDNRTDKDLSKPSVKAFQFDYPELHQYFVDVAQELIADVEYAEKLTKANMYERGSAIESGPVRQLMDMGLTKPEIIKALQDIIANNGQENYAKAKKVERVLSEMMTDGWRDLKNQNHDAVPDYIAAKDSINGAIKSDSWEKYLADHETVLALGEVTEEQLRQEWEQMHPQEEAATVAEPEPTPEASQPVETASAAPEPAPQPGTEGTQSEQSATDSRGYTGPLVDTQDRVFETQLTDEEKQIPGLTAEEARHVQHHDAEVDIRAKERIAADAEKARADLLAAESWNDEDTATAGYIIQEELEAAEKASSVEERAAIYKRLAELKKQWNKQGTEQGRALRQRQRFVAEDMVAAAADILYGDKGGKNEKALRKLNPQAKDAIMGKVREYAKRFNDMQKNGGTVGDLIQLIKDVSVQRRTTGLFSRENGRAVDFALSEVAKQEGGVDFLKELATTQIKSIASDYIKPGIIDRIKSWRFMAMLSNPATTTANAGSNFVFGSFMEALSGNLALPFDMLMSQVTGQREVAGELGAFSKTKWQGSYDAMLRSFLEVTLDAETEQADYGYKELKGGTFKMVGNPIERLLATIQKYQGYALKTTDQAAKGGAEAQARKGLGKLAERGKAKAENIDTLARQEAEYRTLQSEGRISTAINKIRGAVDEAVHIGNERTGKYGLGSDIMPFARVPANAVAVTLESNPAIGVWNALLQTAKVLSDGKNAEPGQQAKAARAWGRVANGVAVAATFAALAAKGYLRDEDDDNKDIATQRKAEGRSGVQLNISALLRGDASEREDDLWINFSWIPPLNGLANFGADLYRAYTDDGHIDLKDISLASGDALASAFMDFPAVSKISSMIQTYQYSEADGIWGKLLETGVTGTAQTASGILIPNAVRAAAAGLDPYERDVYNTDTYGEGIKNNLISGIPGLRETLPERLDAFGQPVKNEGGLLHFLDKTLIPGDMNRHDRQSDTSKYIESLISATGDKSLQPKRNAPYSVKVNGEKIELSADERTEYKKRTGSAIDSLVQNALTRGMFDGLTAEQQASVVNRYESYAEDRAKAELSSERGASYSSDYSTLLQGVVKPGNGTDNDIPKLKEKNAGEYIAFDTLYKGAVKSGDYSTIDNLLYRYSKLNENTKAVVEAKKPTDLANLLKFRDSGATAKDYYAIKDSIGEEQWNMDASSSTGSHVRLAGLGSADIPDSKKDKLVESGAFKLSFTAKNAYGVLRNAGLKPEQISEWFENADWYASGTGKEATADGSLNAYEVAVAISKMSGLDDSQRETLYQQFKAVLQKPNDLYDTWKNYSYQQTLGRSGNYGRTVGRESAPKSGNALYDYYAERQRKTG